MAYLARVRPLSGVCAKVNSKLYIVFERFVANLTAKVLHLTVALCGVVQQIAPVDEHLGAFATAVGGLALRCRHWFLTQLLRLLLLWL